MQINKVCLLFRWTLVSILLSAGCMRDLRLNGRYMPLDSQPRDGVSQVSVQGLSAGCSSDSCKRNQCSPPFTCVDLWRVHECRCAHKPTHTECNCTVEHTRSSLWVKSMKTHAFKPICFLWNHYSASDMDIIFVHRHIEMLWNNPALTHLRLRKKKHPWAFIYCKAKMSVQILWKPFSNKTHICSCVQTQRMFECTAANSKQIVKEDQKRSTLASCTTTCKTGTRRTADGLFWNL